MQGFFNKSSCVPIAFKSIQKLSETQLEICKNQTSERNMHKQFAISKEQCKNPCQVEEYFGRTQEWINHNKPGTLTLNIFYVSNEVKIQEQYFIYTTVDLIGIVGGNLGLFIGFSFFDKIKQMISFITKSNA